MEISVKCPNCDVLLSLQDKNQGQESTCPICKEKIIIPYVSKETNKDTKVLKTKKSAKSTTGTYVPIDEMPLGVSSTPQTWQVGDIIEGKYKVDEILKENYKVRHLFWNVPLMVKTRHLLLAGEQNKPRAELADIIKKRYETLNEEASKWIQLGTHPNLVSAYYVLMIGGAPRLFLEYVDGGNLQEWMEEGELADIEFVLDLAIQICKGMAHIENNKGSHGDLEPNHIFLTKEGKIKITHFESMQERGKDLYPPLSWPYVAPERSEVKKESRSLTSDIYSFGVILYQMCCKVLPSPLPKNGIDFNSYRKSFFESTITNPREYNSEIPTALGNLILSTLEKDSHKRPSSFVDIERRLCGLYDEITGTAYDRREYNDTNLQAISLNNMALAKLDLAHGKDKEVMEKDALELLQEAIKVDPLCAGAVINYNLLKLRRDILPYTQFRVNTMALLAKQEKRLIHYLAGTSIERGTLIEETIKDVETTLESFPEDHKLLRVYGHLLYKIRKFDEAVQAFERLRATGNATPEDFYLLGASYLESGNQKDASRVWLEGLSEKSNHRYLLLGCAIISAVKGKSDKAEEYFRKILRDHPDFLWGLIHFAEFLSAFSLYVDSYKNFESKPKLAKKLYETILKRAPQLPRATHGYNILAKALSSPIIISPEKVSQPLTEYPQWSSIRLLEGAPGAITSLAITPDGSHVIAGALIEEESTYGSLQIREIPSGRCIHSMEEHTYRVSCVCVSPCGKYAVSGSRDRTLRIWELETGLSLHTLVGHQGWVNCVSITSNSKYLVSGSRDRTLKVWELESGRLIHTLQGHGGGVSGVVVTADNKKIISGGGDHKIVAWKLETGRLTHYLEGHEGPIYSLQVSIDGNIAFSGSGDHTVRIWDLEKGTQIYKLEGHKGPVYNIVVTDDGKYIISASGDNTIRIWDIAKGECVNILQGHTDEVKTLQMSPEGRYLLSGGNDGTLRIWDYVSGTPLVSLEGHRGTITCLGISRDGRYIVSGSEDHTLRIWEDETTRICPPITSMIPKYLFEQYHTTKHDIRHRKKLEKQLDQGRMSMKEKEFPKAMKLYREGQKIEGYQKDPRVLSAIYESAFKVGLKIKGFRDAWLRRNLKGHTDSVECIEITSQGLFISGARDNSIRIWEIETGRCIQTLEGHTSWLKCFAVTSNGEYLISGSRGQSLRVWDIKTGLPYQTLDGHTKWVNAIAIASDNKTLVSAGADNKIYTWDIETGTSVYCLEGHERPVRCVKITPNGRLAVSSSDDNKLIVWDIEEGKSLKVLQGHENKIHCLEINSDGSCAISGSYDGTVRIWNISSGTCIHVIKAHQDWIRSLAIKSDKKILVSGGDDKGISIINIENGKIINRLDGHREGVSKVSITSDGSHVISGSLDGEIKIWKLSDGKLIYTLQGGTGPIYDFALSPEGRYLILNTCSKEIPLWEIDWDWEGEE